MTTHSCSQAFEILMIVQVIQYPYLSWAKHMIYHIHTNIHTYIHTYNENEISFLLDTISFLLDNTLPFLLDNTLPFLLDNTLPSSLKHYHQIKQSVYTVQTADRLRQTDCTTKITSYNKLLIIVYYINL